MKGQTDLLSISPAEDGAMHFGLQGTAGPIDLGGMKEGFQFSVGILNTWKFYNSDFNSNIANVDNVATWLEGGIDSMTGQFKSTFQSHIQYTGPNPGLAPMLTLAADVSSWQVGDKIVVGATHFDSRESEVFTIVDCPECNSNQVKVDRTPSYTHWGRIDPRTGADQRAEVGLLSRNVRFYGEMSSDTCQYARTREQLNPDSPNAGRNYCDYFANINGYDDGNMIDMHGAHMIATAGFSNFHMSHVEIFNAGQPHLARYPIHWHHAGYVGAKGGYEDPSEINSLSIHDTFSRFVTIHATHEARVINVVGYNGHGHGFFLEDGMESENHLVGCLGILIKVNLSFENFSSKYYFGINY